MNPEQTKYIQQRVQKSFEQDRKRQIANLEMMAATHNQINDRVEGMRNRSKQDDNLLCACNGLACEGVCRETHLHRPRLANPTAKNQTPLRKSWAKRCPEAYEN